MALFAVTGRPRRPRPTQANFAAAIIGVGGGTIRDVLAMEIPGILKSGEFYTTAAFGGALLCILLLQVDVSPHITV